MAENGQDRDIEEFFAAARAVTRAPGPDLLGRILADAEAAQPRAPRPAGRSQWGPIARFRRVCESLGGWQAAGGLLAAALAGLWIGVSPPAAFVGVTEGWAYGVWGEAVSLELGDQLALYEELLAGDEP
ncbi:dihydroorotate dehydrogenase [Plastorhodobacter daqingensis]|uniref:Dihydroorotate dehydrogenase n=1 Tax=Plastorhodobacter daqingensis TaxID=1387281 RepID=A0ABW2UIL1_9RHOB